MLALSSQKFGRTEKEEKKMNALFNRLNEKEKKLLDDLSKKSKLPKEEIAEFLFYNSATQYAIDRLKDQRPQHSLILEEISQRISELGDYREIKEEYLSLVEKIRNPENCKELIG
ncbi:MAG: hypothetical protein QXO35_03180 [Candidatus Micrarchaeia archaeon]